jgi:hypothetical protein
MKVRAAYFQREEIMLIVVVDYEEENSIFCNVTIEW